VTFVRSKVHNVISSMLTKNVCVWGVIGKYLLKTRVKRRYTYEIIWHVYKMSGQEEVRVRGHELYSNKKSPFPQLHQEKVTSVGKFIGAKRETNLSPCLLFLPIPTYGERGKAELGIFLSSLLIPPGRNGTRRNLIRLLTKIKRFL